MTYDRDDYRHMLDGNLLIRAEENGIDEEMAIVLAERLASRYFVSGKLGHFRANFQGTKTNA